MKFLYVVLLFTCLILTCTALLPPTNYGSSCYTNFECQYTHGPNCFCLNSNQGQSGECICNMDPNILNPGGCNIDLECQYTYGPNCFCLNKNPGQSGQCICNMDTNIFNLGCNHDSDCKSKAHGHQLCVCSKNDKTPYGECKCYNPLLK